jgi:solute carrier family 29 (equilibrative nucleoside transporter), member 1/2/3
METENPLLQADTDGFVARDDEFTSSLLPEKEQPDSAWDVFRQIWIPSLSVWGTFSTTIGLFPALTVFIESTQKCHNTNRFFNDLFVPFLFLLFNVFDLCGRMSAEATKPIFNAKNVWIASVSRLIFFPLFMLCNISDSKLPVVFNHDAFPIIFMIAMALSNGYVASNCMMMGASSVPAKDSSLAGTIMVFSLTLGLLTGSCISFITVLINEGSV